MKKETHFFEALSRLQAEYKKLGSLTLDEKKAMAIFLLTVLLWATESYQKAWFGFKISVYMTAVIAAVLCLMPRVDYSLGPKPKIKWDFNAVCCRCLRSR